MIFKSQLRHQAITHFLLLWVPWAIIAGIATSYVHAGLLEFSMVMAGLCALGLLYGLVQSWVHWLAFLVCGRRRSRRAIYDYLIMHHYPAPEADDLSAEDYFLAVVKNTALDPELRIKAAAEVGAFAAYAGAFERQRLRAIAKAAQRAIKDYRRWLMHETPQEEIAGPLAQN